MRYPLDGQHRLREVWEHELAARLLFLGVRQTQIRKIVRIGDKLLRDLDHEISGEESRSGRFAVSRTLSVTYAKCCHLSYVVGCYYRAHDFLVSRGGPRDMHFGEWVCLAIQFYNADSEVERIFKGEHVFEICRAAAQNELYEHYCEHCGTIYALSPEARLSLRCPFCHCEKEGPLYRHLRVLTQQQYAKIAQSRRNSGS